MDKYIIYLNETAKLLKVFGSTLNKIEFDQAKQEPFELYCLLAMKICQKKAESFSLLISNKQYVDAIILTRSIMDSLFNLRWIKQVSGEERKERVYKLEAEPYYEFAKEIREMESNNNSIWNKDDVKEFRKQIEKEKDLFPYLVNKLETGERIFKNPPPFYQRLNPELKLKYYHLYRFTSLFIHPGPN